MIEDPGRDAPSTERMLLWSVDERAGFDSVWATASARGLIADGRAVGLAPRPYWLTYRLETGPNYVTPGTRRAGRQSVEAWRA